MADQYQHQNYSQSSNNLGPDSAGLNPAGDGMQSDPQDPLYGRTNEKAMSEMKRVDVNNMKSMADKES